MSATDPSRERVARLEAELDRVGRRLDLLVRLTRDISLNLDDLLSHIIRGLRDVVAAADVGVIYLYDREAGCLYPLACLGYDEESLKQIRLKPGESMSGRVYQSGQAVLTRTPEEVDRLAGPLQPGNAALYAKAIAGKRILSNICAPLRTATAQTIGTVTLSSTHSTFEAGDLALLEGVAGQAAQAIANAQLFGRLADSEERYRQLAEHLPVGIAETTEAGELLYWNPKAEEILGYSRADMKRMRAENVYVDPKDRQELAQALRERGVHSFEYRLRRQDGRQVWVRGTSRVIGDRRAGSQRYLGIMEDVTERKRGEARDAVVGRVRERVWSMQREEDLEAVLVAVREALRAMEVPLHDCGINVVDESTDPPAVRFNSMTGDGRWVVSAEPQTMAVVAGFWRSGVVAYRPDLLQEDIHGERPIIERILGDPVRSVVDVPFSHGTLAVNSLQPHAFSDPHLAVIQQLAGVLSEGFRRQEDLLRLAAERERLTVTLRSIGDAVITTDAQGTITLINQVAEALTGWTQAEALGRPLQTVFRILNERSRQASPSPVDRVMRSGLVVGLANHTVLIARDGTERAIADSGAPIRDRDGRTIGVVLVFRDVTAQRRMEQELQRSEKLESLGVLAGGIAHDFNNILTAITGNVALLKFQSEDEALRQGLDQVERASFRAAALTQQLLTFSRGGAPIKRLSTLGDLMRDSATFALRGSNVRCELEVAQDLWPAEVDAGQMSQVLHNLVLNAGQAMPEGGVVQVRAENATVGGGEGPLEPGNYLKISIADRGVGIPAHHLQRIFEPYFTTKQKGSGLGLATVHAIIANHYGHIDVDSRLGEGTTFTLYLPAAAGQARAADRRQGEILHGQGRVLVMDDEASIRDLAGAILVRLGYQAQVVEDGGEAVRSYRDSLSQGQPFACVILDLTIPGGLGGAETLSRLRQLDPEVRAIASSGYSNDPIMSSPGDYGFRGILAKPYNVHDLGWEVHRVLAAQRTDPPATP